jgi:large subunit ribosomal protein L10
MKTRQQKQKEIETAKENLKKSKTIVFVNFKGISTNELNKFRKTIREMGGKILVIKKRLLNIVLKEKNIEIDPQKLENQVCTIFSPLDTVTTAKTIFNFSKPHRSKKLLAMLLGIEMEENKILDKTELEMLGQLPSKEELLARLVFMISSPLKKLVFVLNEKSKKS